MTESEPEYTTTLRRNGFVWLSVAVILVGVFMVWSYVHDQTTFVCERAAGECEYQRQTAVPWGNQQATFPIEAIERAKVELRRNWGSDGLARTVYNAVLETADGAQYRLTNTGRMFDWKPERLANAVNRFAAGHGDGTLELRDTPAWTRLATALVILLIGLTVLLSTNNTVDVFVRPGSDELWFQRRRWWRSRGEPFRLKLSDIQRVDIAMVTAKGRRRGRNRRNSRVVFRTRSNRSRSHGTVPLFRSHGSLRTGKRHYQALRSLLAEAGWEPEPETNR